MAEQKTIINNTPLAIVAECASGSYEARTILPGQNVEVTCNNVPGVKVTALPPLPKTVSTESAEITVTQEGGELLLTPFEA